MPPHGSHDYALLPHRGIALAAARRYLCARRGGRYAASVTPDDRQEPP